MNSKLNKLYESIHKESKTDMVVDGIFDLYDEYTDGTRKGIKGAHNNEGYIIDFVLPKQTTEFKNNVDKILKSYGVQARWISNTRLQIFDTKYESIHKESVDYRGYTIKTQKLPNGEYSGMIWKGSTQISGDLKPEQNESVVISDAKEYIDELRADYDKESFHKEVVYDFNEGDKVLKEKYSVGDWVILKDDDDGKNPYQIDMIDSDNYVLNPVGKNKNTKTLKVKDTNILFSVSKESFHKESNAPEYIDTMMGRAKLYTIENEDERGRWNDNYNTRDGFYIIHNGNEHRVYKLEKESYKEASVNTRYAVYDNNNNIIKIFEDRDDAWKFIDNHKNDKYTWAVYPESFRKEANNLPKVSGCYNCGKRIAPGEKTYTWYHGDQDDQVCSDCASKLKHTDTGLAGMPVKESYEADDKYKNMSINEAKALIGNRPTWELRNMKKALTSLRLMNDESDEKRLAAVLVLLKNSKESVNSRINKLYESLHKENSDDDNSPEDIRTLRWQQSTIGISDEDVNKISKLNEGQSVDVKVDGAGPGRAKNLAKVTKKNGIFVWKTISYNVESLHKESVGVVKVNGEIVWKGKPRLTPNEANADAVAAKKSMMLLDNTKDYTTDVESFSQDEPKTTSTSTDYSNKYPKGIPRGSLTGKYVNWMGKKVQVKDGPFLDDDLETPILQINDGGIIRRIKVSELDN